MIDPEVLHKEFNYILTNLKSTPDYSHSTTYNSVFQLTEFHKTLDIGYRYVICNDSILKLTNMWNLVHCLYTGKPC